MLIEIRNPLVDLSSNDRRSRILQLVHETNRAAWPEYDDWHRIWLNVTPSIALQLEQGIGWAPSSTACFNTWIFSSLAPATAVGAIERHRDLTGRGGALNPSGRPQRHIE